MIHREDDEIYESLEVELIKKRERGLGLSIVGKKSGPGVFISEVVKGGAADVDGRKPGFGGFKPRLKFFKFHLRS